LRGAELFYATAKVKIILTQKNLWINIWSDFSQRGALKKNQAYAAFYPRF